MYQKPDFVKVDVDVKDNFAGYTVDCKAWDTELMVNTEIAGTGCTDKHYYLGRVIDLNVPWYECYNDVV